MRNGSKFMAIKIRKTDKDFNTTKETKAMLQTAPATAF